jgi:hypothetical protein
MLDMFFNSLKLFFKGKLFREPAQVARQWLIGLVAAALLLPLLVKLGLPVWLAVVLVALGVGALQPWLFRNLKYA